jgi:hypothetical protein
VEAEEVSDLTPVNFVGSGSRNRRLAVSAYDMDESDDSVALVVVHFDDEAEIGTLRTTEATRQFVSVQNFVEESLTGVFQAGREESTDEYQLAEDLRRRGRSVTRYRLYLVTNQALSSRAKDLPSAYADGIPVEFHVWDIERFKRVFESSFGREELTIDLTEWESAGIPALKASYAGADTTTYLLVLPALVLAELYGRYGGRLLEGNVRAYLSNRGKVNRGIRESVLSRPDRFLAYNNGITATATAIELREGAITQVTNLQIVNGGQTTASLFYANRETKQATQFQEAFVQAKLVVVSAEDAAELVPNISRFANSQNKVNEADFFSNSPFHVRLEDLSRRTLTPAKPGVMVQSKWFYERTRGQYDSEKGKVGRAGENKFAAVYPKSHLINKTDAAKYEVAWAQKPHIVSAGAEKNFVAFANEVAKTWETSSDSINETYFKHLVARAILYRTLRKAVADQPWYNQGYLAPIVTYTISKLARVVESVPDGHFDFDAVWQQQDLSEATLSFGLAVAEHVMGVLESDDRPVQNVTEWAKREACWTQVSALPISPPQNVVNELVSRDQARSGQKAARQQQRVDDGIGAQTAAMAISRGEWKGIEEFAKQNRLLTPTDAGIVALMTRPVPAIPSEKQAARLMELRDRAIQNGYAYRAPRGLR